jgi:hypothetical protein
VLHGLVDGVLRQTGDQNIAVVTRRGDHAVFAEPVEMHGPGGGRCAQPRQLCAGGCRSGQGGLADDAECGDRPVEHPGTEGARRLPHGQTERVVVGVVVGRVLQERRVPATGVGELLVEAFEQELVRCQRGRERDRRAADEKARDQDGDQPRAQGDRPKSPAPDGFGRCRHAHESDALRT